MALTPQQRALRSRAAAHLSWSITSDRPARTHNARQAFLARFERQVDPEGRLTAPERQRRAEQARKAYFASLALKSSRVRAARRAS